MKFISRDEFRLAVSFQLSVLSRMCGYVTEVIADTVGVKFISHEEFRLAVSFQLSAISYQLSAISYQLSAISFVI
ncbi:hypothetical protein [Pseudoalteromonas sp. CnMc7-37]|uniref:hypothetical protein n=1 Tax=Pseudoalteromonas sp. CnMc7-37 TaxID=2954496 RepID=UPI002096958A|nr:hypothetical protein [Pseudoalteromonas sp. CnMc7-37]MCO7208941.1 hypothetical protein [Pseudoalteromonas sp. CnMc7-37]